MVFQQILEKTAANYVAGQMPRNRKVARDLNLDFFKQTPFDLKDKAYYKVLFQPRHHQEYKHTNAMMSTLHRKDVKEKLAQKISNLNHNSLRTHKQQSELSSPSNKTWDLNRIKATNLKVLPRWNHRKMTHETSTSQNRLDYILKELAKLTYEDDYYNQTNKVSAKKTFILKQQVNRIHSQRKNKELTELKLDNKTEKVNKDLNKLDLDFLSCLEDANDAQGLEYFMSGLCHVLQGSKQHDPNYQQRPRLYDCTDSITKSEMRLEHADKCEWMNKLLDPSVKRIWDTPVKDATVESILNSLAVKVDPAFGIWNSELESNSSKSQSEEEEESVSNDSVLKCKDEDTEMELGSDLEIMEFP